MKMEKVRSILIEPNYFIFRFLNKKISIFLIFFLINFITSFSQSSEVIVFSENWDDGTSLEPWYPNFTSGWFQNSPKNQIVGQPERGNSLRLNFAAGNISADAGIGNYRVYLDSLYKELYFSFEYWLDPDFSFGYEDTDGGGKFFCGLSGGNAMRVPRIQSDTSVGWSYFMIFQNGTYWTYPYFYNNSYSDGGFPMGNKIANIVRGQWREVTMRIRINDPNQANGILEMFDNGILVYQNTRCQITSPNHPEWYIDAIYLNAFFGGISPCPKSQYAMLDNLVAWYYPKGSSNYREGASESGRRISAPRVKSYHPDVPNKFTETTYTDASGRISSHCGFDMPIIHNDGFEKSTISINDATRITINVTEFSYDSGQNYSGYKSKLNIYAGTGSGVALTKSFEYGQNVSVPSQIEIQGNSATIEWQSGRGDRRGFTLSYSSDGSGSGKNFTCSNYYADQLGTAGNPPSSVVTPLAPTQLQASSITSNSVKLNWKDNSSIETAYEIECLGPDNINLVHTFKTDANATTYTSTGLTQNSTYVYKVRAYNAISGYSAYSNSIEVRTPVTAPADPTSLQLISDNSTSATLQWSDNSNNESWFEIRRQGPTDTNIFVTIKTNPDINVYIDSSLVADSYYKYAVRAYNTSGGYSGWSNTTEVNTPERSPLPPSSIKALNVQNTSATIIWTDNSDNEKTFEIERRGPNNDELITIFSVAENSTSFIDTGLISNSEYKFRIRARNSSGGYSSYSETLQIKTTDATLPNAPSRLQAKKFTNNSITIRWDDNSVDENEFVITRTSAFDEGNTVSIKVNANDTVYEDKGLEPSKTYYYLIKAINNAGVSPNSNRVVSSTISLAETKRVYDNLVAYYNFNYDPDNYVHDLSGYGDPLDLNIVQPESINWEEEKKLEILSDVEISSTVPAKKLVYALKKTDEITVECWVRPTEPAFVGCSRIVSLSTDDSEIGFTLDQNYNVSGLTKTLGYCVRLQTASTVESGYPEIIQNNMMEFLTLNHVLYKRDSLGKETLYVNNHIAAEGIRPSHFNTWNENFYLRLSNEKDLTRGWKGMLYSVAIYNKALSDEQIARNFAAKPCDDIITSEPDLQLNMYPNPVNDRATIEILPLNNQYYAPRTKFRIIDGFGSVIYETIIFNPNIRYTQTLDFGNYRKGIYFMQTISGKEIKSQKFVIR